MESDGSNHKQTNISYHASSDIENPCTPLVHSMEEELERLSPLSSDCSIYRVGEFLRHGHERVYTPHTVSIGPLHHGEETLKDMEQHKMWYLKAFIGRTKESMGFYVALVEKKEAELRRCYSEKIQCSSEEFIKIILVDAVFIIELLLRFYFKELNDENDSISNRPRSRDIWCDMMLLENQLPFFILEDLYNASKKLFQSFQNEEKPSILKLSHFFFKEVVKSLRGTEEHKLEVICSSKIEHFVDLLRQLHIPFKKLERRRLETLTTPSVTELHQAGVKFEVGSSGNLFDIHFESGILKIPRFDIGRDSEVIIRNIMAFEQYHWMDHYMNDYVVLLSCLVITPKDVDLLIKYGIMEKRSNINEGANHVQNISRGAMFSSVDFYFASLCEDLNTYCRTSWHEWKANLKQNYFNTPWAIMSFIAAVVLLVLTLIQTVSSVISIS